MQMHKKLFTCTQSVSFKMTIQAYVINNMLHKINVAQNNHCVSGV